MALPVATTYFNTKNLSLQEYIFFIVWAILIMYMGSVYVYEHNEGLHVKGTSQWLDIPVHIAYIKHFISTPLQEWFSTHPLNIEQEFTYHFLADLISAGLHAAGISMKWSLSLPVVIATIGFMHVGYLYFKNETNDKYTSMFVISSFFLFGGLGFIYRIINPEFFIENMYETSVFTTEGKLAIAAFPNVLAGMLFAQRGLPLGLWFFFSALYFYKTRNNTIQCAVWIVLLNALMMLSLIHASMALMIFMGLSFLQKPSKFLFILNAVLALESAVIFYLFYTSALGGSFVSFMPGFYFGFSQNITSYISFWISSTSIIIPALLLILIKTKTINIKLVFVICIFIFINIVKLQPNPWDNVKLLILILPFIYEYIVTGIKHLNCTTHFRKGLLFILAIAIWPTGAWDIYEISFTKRMDFELYTQEDTTLAKELDALLPKDARVIIENKHNHMAIQLLDRHPLLGFQFNLDTYGHDYRALKNDINKALEGNPDKDFINKYKVGAIIIRKTPLYDKREAIKMHIYIQHQDHVSPNIEKLRQSHEVIAENRNYIVFKP